MIEIPGVPSDTDPHVQAFLYAELAKMSLEEKLRRVFDLSEAVRQLIIAGVKYRNPNCSKDEIQKRFAAILLGGDFTRKYLGWDPDIEGFG